MIVDVSDLITQTTAAHLRGVSRPAIRDLVTRGCLRSVEIDGTVFVYRSQVLAYKPGKRQQTRKMTNSEVLEDVIRVIRLVKHIPSSYKYQKHGRISLSTFCKRFGSWANACRAAQRQMNKAR